MVILTHLVFLFCLFWPQVACLCMYRTPEVKRLYDYIVVGGGSSGTVLASRLSEDKSKTVLLLEAGDCPPGITEVPTLAPLLAATPEDWGYVTEPQKDSFLLFESQTSYWTRYKALGGCSSHNFMIYNRGNKKDYDQWANMGAKGWDWKSVLPYFKKSEDQLDPELQKNGYHGKGGYLTVTKQPYISRSGAAMLAAAEQAIGLPQGDYNGRTQTVISECQVTQRDGFRCSTEKAFLRPAAGRRNLDVLTNAHATKINFKGNRAVSVSFDHKNQTNMKVRARKEIILSAGVVGSPQLLLISGIGPREHLREMGIPLVADLPVGENLHDHVAAPMYFAVEDDSQVNLTTVLNTTTVGMLLENKGPLTTAGTLEITGFVGTKYQDKSEDWPDIQIHSLLTGLLPPLDTVKKEFQAGLAELMTKNIKTVAPIVIRPRSRGYLKLRTTNIYDHPIIDPRYLTEELDMKTLIEGLKLLDTWMNAPELEPFKLENVFKKMQTCENTTYGSDEYYECYIRSMTSSTWHPVGTCKMGDTADNTTVVDPKLRVKGVRNLRVVDASVMPAVTSSNTNAPCIMIAEKAADMIRGRKPKK